MSLNTQRKVALVRRETAQGSDALLGVSAAGRGAFGIPTLELDISPSRESIDRRLHSGDFGREKTLVGYGSAQNSMGVDFRGSGQSDQIPNYDDLLLSCGLRRQTMRRTLYVAAPAGLDETDTLANNELPHRGEQVHCQTNYAAAGWGDSVVSGVLQNAGSGAVGQVGDRVKVFPPDGSADSPTSTGTLVHINDLGNVMTVRYDAGQVARPKNGDFFRVEQTDGTLRGFNVFAEDTPVMILLDYDKAPGTNIVARICYVMEQGDEPSLNAHMATQESQILMVFGDAEDHGLVYRPTSDQLVEFVVDWGGSSAIPADFQNGREFLRIDGPGNQSAAFVVESFTHDTEGPTDKTTIQAQMLYGSITGGNTVYFVDIAGVRTAATVDSSPAPFAVESPSVTIWNVIDGFLRAVSGARGNLQIECSAGNPGRMSFEHTGLISETGRMITQPTGVRGSNVTPPNWQLGVGEVAGVPLRMKQFSMNLQNTVSRRANANALEGTEEYAITDRDPNLSLTFDRAGVAAFAVEQRERDATETPAAVFVGSDPGNRVGIVVPRGQVMNPNDGDEEGSLTVQIDLMARRTAEDGDELFIVHR